MIIFLVVYLGIFIHIQQIYLVFLKKSVFIKIVAFLGCVIFYTPLCNFFYSVLLDDYTLLCNNNYTVSKNFFKLGVNLWVQRDHQHVLIELM